MDCVTRASTSCKAHTISLFCELTAHSAVRIGKLAWHTVAVKHNEEKAAVSNNDLQALLHGDCEAHPVTDLEGEFAEKLAEAFIQMRILLQWEKETNFMKGFTAYNSPDVPIVPGGCGGGDSEV